MHLSINKHVPTTFLDRKLLSYFFIADDLSINDMNSGDDEDNEDDGKPPIKLEENGIVAEEEKEKAVLKESPEPRSPERVNSGHISPLGEHKLVNTIKADVSFSKPESPSPSPKMSMAYSMAHIQNADHVTTVSQVFPSHPKPVSPTIPHRQTAMPSVHEKVPKLHSLPSQSQEPPAKMPRRDMRLDESAILRHQQMRYLDLLSRLFPEQKRGVIELILKGCNGDIVQAIECILPSHERAVAQMSGMPGQSFTLPPASVDEGNRHRYQGHGSEKPVPPMSAFMPFNASPGHGQHAPGHPQHGYAMVPVPPCPPGCNCQLSQQKCPCPDCVPQSSSKGTKAEINGPKSNLADSNSPSTIATSSFSEIHVSPKDGTGKKRYNLLSLFDKFYINNCTSTLECFNQSIY